MNQHIIVLLDVSYSMQFVSDKIVIGLNNFIKSLLSRNDRDSLFFSLVLFSNKTYFIYKKTPIKTIQTIKLPQCSGYTCLYDNMAKVFLKWRSDMDSIHNLYIVTDGDDTGSDIYSKEIISSICDEMIEKYHWKITHCNIDESKLDSANIQKVIYDVNDIDSLLQNLIL